MQDEGCRNCLLEFAKQVVAYLKKFNFLVFQQQISQESDPKNFDGGNLPQAQVGLGSALSDSKMTYVSGKIAATQLGKAAFASSIPPEHALKIFCDLAEARG